MTDPLDEDIALWTFRALDALHMQRAIVIAYNKTARYFEEEMGRPLCAEIGSIYAAAAEAVNKTEPGFCGHSGRAVRRAAQPAQRPRCVLLQL